MFTAIGLALLAQLPLTLARISGAVWGRVSSLASMGGTVLAMEGATLMAGVIAIAEAEGSFCNLFSSSDYNSASWVYNRYFPKFSLN